MTLSTYGLGTSVRGPAGTGESVLGLGAAQRATGMDMLGRAASEETQREIANKQLAQEAKAGNVQLGSTLGGIGGFAAGAQAGSIGGPWGALIGGALGAIAGGLF